MPCKSFKESFNPACKKRGNQVPVKCCRVPHCTSAPSSALQSCESRVCLCCRLAKRLCRVQVRAAATEKQEDVDIEEDAVPEYFPNVVLAGCCKACLQRDVIRQPTQARQHPSAKLGPSLLRLHADEQDGEEPRKHTGSFCNSAHRQGKRRHAGQNSGASILHRAYQHAIHPCEILY